jgi:hypothetical protein
METSMEQTPQVTTLEGVQRPPWWGVDLELARRPGVPMLWKEPRPWPNSRYPPERQPGEPSTPRHGRPNKPMPPVFGTSVPLRGVSGALRRLAYSYPDHLPRHWLLKLFADRVDSWGHRARGLLPLALPLAALGLVGGLLRR